jgi:tetratricopeptide (TPR) repeat protein
MDTKTSEVKSEIRRLEEEFTMNPSRENLNKLVDVYIEQRDSRALQRALSLVVKNLDRYGQEPPFLHRAISVLVLIQENPSAVKLASELTNRLIELEPGNLLSYGNAAYFHWRLGNLAAAIEISELAPRRFEDAKNTDELLQLKGNLAYYYAERGLKQDAETARRLAREVYEKTPTASRADTMGYVLLQFAADRNDVQKASEYFQRAKAEIQRLGITNVLLEQHLAEASKRLEGI